MAPTKAGAMFFTKTKSSYPSMTRPLCRHMYRVFNLTVQQQTLYGRKIWCFSLQYETYMRLKSVATGATLGSTERWRSWTEPLQSARRLQLSRKPGSANPFVMHACHLNIVSKNSGNSNQHQSVEPAPPVSRGMLKPLGFSRQFHNKFAGLIQQSLAQNAKPIETTFVRNPFMPTGTTIRV